MRFSRMLLALSAVAALALVIIYAVTQGWLLCAQSPASFSH